MLSNTCRIYQSGNVDVFSLSLVMELATDDNKPQGTVESLDPIPKENESMLMGIYLLYERN